MIVISVVVLALALKMAIERWPWKEGKKFRAVMMDKKGELPEYEAVEI